MNFLSADGPMSDQAQEFLHYAISMYGNSARELVVFGLLLTALFLGRLLFLQVQVRHHRARLPLVIGGWGTRGKSGTERLKAAIFNELGLTTISKTTGCEAMIVISPPFGAATELFLFRPYDKATIWEQQNVVRMASALDAQVVLWECMGLNPEFVRILQGQWMRDDYATLTNAFPDHEDVHGPAGINVPEVMTRFIPHGSPLVTSEEAMLPILREGARAADAPMSSINWLDAGLLTPDLLVRFPYEEHPFNIALVVRLADHLGLPRDHTLKAMADRVVPDLGVLKTFAGAELRGRRLEFIMGMSANERYGALSNWKRMGFATHDPRSEPQTWIATVVNNRADRVPRSRVFARVLVRDVRADCHVLIGTNLNGLHGFIREEFALHAAEQRLPAGLDAASRRARWLEQAQSQGRITTLEFLQARVTPVIHHLLPQAADFAALYALAGQPEQLESALLEHGAEPTLLAEAAVFFRDWAGEFTALHETLERALASTDEAQAQTLWWGFLAQRFEAGLIVIQDSYASPQEIVERLAASAPPGTRVRIMGLQNIKGTGLPFVYSWLDADVVFKALTQMRGGKPQEFERGVRSLRALAKLPLQVHEALAQALTEFLDGEHELGRRYEPELRVLRTDLERARASHATLRQQLASGSASDSGGGKFSDRLVAWLEQVLDAGDAIRRRQQADRVYRDLAQHRISISRAASVVQELTQRQKGGWLAKTLKQRALARHAGDGLP